MANFQYSFQSILDVKEKQKEQAQIQMSKAISLQESVEMSIKDISERIQHVEQNLIDKQKQGTSVLELHRLEQYLTALKRKLSAEYAQLDLALQNVNRKQSLLNQSMVEEKKWTKLKEREKLVYTEQMQRIERYQEDELAGQRHYQALKLRGEGLV